MVSDNAYRRRVDTYLVDSIRSVSGICSVGIVTPECGERRDKCHPLSERRLKTQLQVCGRFGVIL